MRSKEQAQIGQRKPRFQSWDRVSDSTRDEVNRLLCSEHFQRTHFQRCGGGRRVIRKRIGGE